MILYIYIIYYIIHNPVCVFERVCLLYTIVVVDDVVVVVVVVVVVGIVIYIIFLSCYVLN